MEKEHICRSCRQDTNIECPYYKKDYACWEDTPLKTKFIMLNLAAIHKLMADNGFNYFTGGSNYNSIHVDFSTNHNGRGIAIEVTDYGNGFIWARWGFDLPMINSKAIYAEEELLKIINSAKSL